MNSSDRALIQKWTTCRDADAFAEIVSRYSSMVYATCLRILRNGAEAEEVAQECFLKLATGGTAVKSSLGGWLHKLATDRALNRVREDRRRQARESRFAENSAASAEANWDDIQSYVDEVIAALPEKLRGPLVGHFLEGQTYDEIAKRLGIPRSTAASRVQKGLEMVRKSLKKRGIPISAGGLAALVAANTSHAAPASLAAALGKLAIAGAGLPSAASTAAAGAGIVPKSIAIAGITIAAKKALIGLGALLIASLLTYSFYRRPEKEVVEQQSGAVVEAVKAPQGETPYVTEADSPALQAKDPIAPETAASTPEEEHGLPEKQSEVVMPGSISGFVMDDEGYALTGAAVTVLVNGNVHSAEVDSSGMYTIERLTFSGETIVSAYADGFTTGSQRVTPAAGEHLENIDFTLSRGVMLNALLLNVASDPVANAIVTLWGFTPSSTPCPPFGLHDEIRAVTDAGGYFSLGFPKTGEAVLRVKSSFGQATFTGVPVGADELLELRMPEQAVLTGMITLQDGTPASGLKVQLTATTGSRTWPWASGRTNVHGRYRIPGIDPGETTYLAMIKATDGKTLCPEYDLGTFAPGETKTWNYVLSEPMTVRGHVVGEHTGQPLAHVWVACLQDGLFPEKTAVHEDGFYELRLFTPGTYFIFPEHYGWPEEYLIERYGQQIGWTSGEQIVVDFELPEAFTLSIRVVGIDGNPIEGATIQHVTVLDDGSPSLHGSGYSNAAGEYMWNGFAPYSECWFYIEKEGFIPTGTAHCVGEPAAVYPVEEVVLFASTGVEGRVVDSEGLPIANVDLALKLEPDSGVIRALFGLIDGPTSVEVKTDVDGRFATAQGLPATTGMLAIHGPPYASTTISVELVAGGILDLGQIVLYTSGR
jgi:RNA polymerase sigma factor (sigma-70 family)